MMLEFFTRQKVFSILASVFLCVVGISLFIISPKESLPEIKLGIILVNTLYPNAAPQEVEKLVTTPLEDAVKNIKGIKEISSSSSDSYSVIVITLKADAGDSESILNDVKAAVDRVNTLPENAEKPEVSEVTTDEFPVITAQLSGGRSYEELREAARVFEEKLKEIKGVSSIRKAGYLDRAIWVEGDVKKLKDYGMTIFSLINSIKSANLSIPAGNKKFDGAEYSIRAIAELKGSGDVAKVIVRSNESGKYVTAGDLSAVTDGFKERASIIKADAEPAITLTLLKARGEDSLKISRDSRKLAEKIKKDLPGGIKIKFTGDAAKFIRDRLNVVNSNGIFGGILVLAILLVFLRPAIAVLTAASIPVAFGASLIAVKLLGYSYDMLSLFGYVMVLGMLVDNAIVVSENVYRYAEKGMKIFDATVKGAGEVFIPALASILTTVASFLPLVFVSGVLGSFLRPIPVAIIITLLLSLVTAYFILPALINSFLKTGDTSLSRWQDAWFEKFSSVYAGLLGKVMNRKAIFIAAVVLMLPASFFLGSRSGFSFFSSESDEITIDIKTPSTNSLEDTEKITDLIEKRAAESLQGNTETIISYTGQQNSQSGPPKLASNIAQVSVFLKLESERKIKNAEEILKILREAIGTPEGAEDISIKTVRREGGGAREDISITVTGDSYDEIQAASEALLNEIRAVKGVKQAAGDLEQGKKEYRLIIDDKKAATAGVNIAQIGAALRGIVSGTKATSIKSRGEDIDIIVKADASGMKTLGDILDLYVPNQAGRSVPIRPFVRVEEGYSFTVLKHKDTKKSLVISGSIDRTESTVAKVNAGILSKIPEIQGRFPRVEFIAGGEFREMMDSFADLGRAFLVALFLIFLITATLFNSFTQPAIVMLAIPFGFIGVMLTLFIHGQPVSFGVFMGFVALTGVVVNNSIILNDFVNRLSIKQKDREKAIIEASKIRLRPIFLTTLTTAAGLLPLAYGLFGNKDAFLQPVALVFAWGLLFSTLVTLFIIPIFLSVWGGNKKKA